MDGERRFSPKPGHDDFLPLPRVALLDGVDPAPDQRNPLLEIRVRKTERGDARVFAEGVAVRGVELEISFGSN